MLETLLEPVQSQEHDKRVDGDWIRQHGEEEDDALLEGREVVHIDRVETGLRSAAARKEQGINVRNPAIGKDQDGPQDGESDDPEVCMMSQFLSSCVSW